TTDDKFTVPHRDAVRQTTPTSGGCSAVNGGSGAKFPRLPQPARELVGEAVGLDRAGDGVGDLLQLVGRLAHRDPAAGPAEHLDVVVAVADREGVGGRETPRPAHDLEP